MGEPVKHTHMGRSLPELTHTHVLMDHFDLDRDVVGHIEVPKPPALWPPAVGTTYQASTSRWTAFARYGTRTWEGPRALSAASAMRELVLMLVKELEDS